MRALCAAGGLPIASVTLWDYQGKTGSIGRQRATLMGLTMRIFSASTVMKLIPLVAISVTMVVPSAA